MLKYKKELESIATNFLNNYEQKPQFSKRDFMNAVIIFQGALMDKMYDLQNDEKMEQEDRFKMATSCGLDLRKLIYTYTGLDTHKVEEFI